MGIIHHLRTSRNENWMLFGLADHDYDLAPSTYPLLGNDDKIVEAYQLLDEIGFLDKVILKGKIVLQSETVSEATLKEVYNAYGARETPYLVSLFAR